MRANPRQDRGDPAPGADRHRRFGHHHRLCPARSEAIGKRPADLLGRGKDMAQIGMPVAAPRRRADRDEHRVSASHRPLQIGRERQAPRRHIARYQCLQPRLVDRHLAPLQPLDLRRVLVDAHNLDPKLRKTRPRYQPHIPRPYHRYAHWLSFLS